ncbi:MAG: hypothetical protein KME27_03015 [Lyngbya sp. HA4199-MV5]|jgi:hypothetical protein|nr:hypothetical protein [Lyngbya sp. HA4199-MV5]
MPNPSLLSTLEKVSASATSAEAAPFDWATVHQTVLKFVNPLASEQPIAPPTSSVLLAAMQRLVTIINTVQASPLVVSKGSPSETPKLETLLPYVSEEAYDVLDALRSDLAVATSSQSPLGSDRAPLSLSSSASHSLITIESLIPSLLWQIARSAYSAMHLIEGIRAKCWLPDQGWVSGMLRLVVMLEVEAPTIRWCFDLATGYPAESLLEATAIVQSDESALPIRHTAVDASDDSPSQVKHQLQTILRHLQARVPGLSTFLQGVPIELLQPGADWQGGNLRLHLGFSFSPQADGDEAIPRQPELIEAELMEETLAQTNALQRATATKPTIASLVATHVPVVQPVGRSLRPTTLVRLTDTEALERYTQQTAQQQLEQALSQLCSQQIIEEEEESQLTLIVQAAIAHCAHQPSASGLERLHPMLLMDELVPKLLWSITSSTYDMMQLVGGIPAHVLQPRAHWQQGTLRLLAALHLKAADVDYQLDLSTGRSIEADVPLDLGTIVQTNTTIGSQPTSIATIINQVEQQLHEMMLAYRLLKNGAAIAWLEDVEQDWQSGTMKLSVSLAFVADAR